MAGVQTQTRPREEDAANEEQHGKADPSLDPVEQIIAQMSRMLDTTTEFTIGRLTTLRDRVDDVMRQHQARQRELLEDVERYAQDCADTVSCEKVMSEALDVMIQQIGRRVPSTVTALRPRERTRA